MYVHVCIWLCEPSAVSFIDIAATYPWCPRDSCTYRRSPCPGRCLRSCRAGSGTRWCCCHTRGPCSREDSCRCMWQDRPDRCHSGKAPRSTRRCPSRSASRCNLEDQPHAWFLYLLKPRSRLFKAALCHFSTEAVSIKETSKLRCFSRIKHMPSGSQPKISYQLSEDGNAISASTTQATRGHYWENAQHAGFKIRKKLGRFDAKIIF